MEKIKNLVWVSPSLATAGQPSEQQLSEVATQGFEVVINLGLPDPRYCLDDEAGLVKSLSLAYQHIPVEFQAPELEDLQQFFAAMDVSHGKKVFVHCAANKRASCFVALYGQMRWEWSSDMADAFIRRIWEPDQIWEAFLAQARRRLI